MIWLNRDTTVFTLLIVKEFIFHGISNIMASFQVVHASAGLLLEIICYGMRKFKRKGIKTYRLGMDVYRNDLRGSNSLVKELSFEDSPEYILLMCFNETMLLWSKKVGNRITKRDCYERHIDSKIEVGNHSSFSSCALFRLFNICIECPNELLYRAPSITEFLPDFLDAIYT